MGEIAEMILDGELCQVCGCYIGPGAGQPAHCPSCEPKPLRILPPKPKVRCTVCGKRVNGLADHMHDAHGVGAL
jgi:hypothetical protein